MKNLRGTIDAPLFYALNRIYSYSSFFLSLIVFRNLYVA